MLKNLSYYAVSSTATGVKASYTLKAGYKYKIGKCEIGSDLSNNSIKIIAKINDTTDLVLAHHVFNSSIGIDTHSSDEIYYLGDGSVTLEIEILAISGTMTDLWANIPFEETKM